MKTQLDINTWNRKEHYNYFRNFNEPFYHLNMDVECSEGFSRIKRNGDSAFAWYLHCAMKAANSVPEFRYRMEGEDVFIYDTVHASPTISREDGTFGFAQIDFTEDFLIFQNHVEKEISRVQSLSGLFTAPERADVIHYSVLPWFSFSGLSHPRNFGDGDSIPKISFGKIFKRGQKSYLPLSVHVHHALVDGYHVAQFVKQFGVFLNS